MRRRRWGLIGALALAVVVLAGFAGFAVFRWGASDVEPQSLLVTPQVLPTTGHLLDQPARPAAIQLELTERASLSVPKSGECSPLGALAVRVWDDRGMTLGTPSLVQEVCREPSEPLAWLYYRWASLASAAGEDWPNFDFGSEDQIVPDHIGIRPSADDFEVGCGAGSANELCSVWVYRARYGPFLVIVLYLSTNGIGLTSEEFGGLIQQFDSAIMARL